MNGISTSATIQAASSRIAASNAIKKPPKEDLELREKFQDFVAGTFYKEMLKSMRRMHDKPAYFHGGQAEEMFQSQMDQQVAEELARGHGGALSDSLYKVYMEKSRASKMTVPVGQVDAAYAASSSHFAGEGK